MVVLALSMGMLAGCCVSREKIEVGKAIQSDTSFAQMSGNWKIDFDRTDTELWGFGASQGNGMARISIGYEELLLCFDGGGALNVEYIWGYKNGITLIELSAFPLMSYNNNGIIEVGWSHNQGLAGDF